VHQDSFGSKYLHVGHDACLLPCFSAGVGTCSPV
jgi:hypothetical protein